MYLAVKNSLLRLILFSKNDIITQSVMFISLTKVTIYLFLYKSLTALLVLKKDNCRWICCVKINRM